MTFYHCLRQAARTILRDVPNASIQQFSKSVKPCNHAIFISNAASIPSLSSISSLAKLHSDGLQSSLFRGVSAATMFGTTNSKFSIPAPSFHISTQTQRTQDTSDISLENLSAPSGVSLAGSEDDDEEGVLPYSQRNSRKRSRLKEMDGSPQSGEIDEDYDSLASVAIVEKFELLPRCDRHQPDLNASESKFIWSLAQRLAHDKKLVRAQIGARRGLCGAVLDNLGQNLKVHEIIRVDVPASTGLDMKFLKNLLPDLLDCVVVKVKGRTLTLYRDTSLPPVHRRLQASDSAEQDINEVVKRA